MTTKRRYFITMGGDEPIEVELEYSVEEQCWFADVDGERLALNLQGVGFNGQVLAQVDGEAIDLQLFDDGQGGFRLGNTQDGKAYPIRARTDGEIVLAAPSEQKTAVKSNPTVTCPITGEVLSVLVRKGQSVSEGETLVVVEAMKMETVIKSPQVGTVKEIHVNPGDRVMAGATLVSLAG